MVRYKLAVLGHILLWLGAAIAVIAILCKLAVQRERRWVRVSGRISNSRVLNSSDYYYTDVEYNYELSGCSFKGTKIRSLNISTNWKPAAENQIAKYDAGSVVSVYVNPTNPREAVLEPGGDKSFLPLYLVIASTLLVVGILLLRSCASCS